MTHEPPEDDYGTAHWVSTNNWVSCPNCGNEDVLFNGSSFDGGGWSNLLFCPECDLTSEGILAADE